MNSKLGALTIAVVVSAIASSIVPPALSEPPPGAKPADITISVDEGTVIDDSPPRSMQLHATQSAITGASPFVQVSMPVNSNGSLSVSKPNEVGNLTVGMPSDPLVMARGVKPGLGQGDPVVDEGNGTVLYRGVLLHTNVRMIALDDSARIEIVSLSDAAPTSFSFPVNVPAGGKMSVQDGGNVAIFDGPDPETANLVGGFSPPYSTDSNGLAIPTHYEVSGRNLIQVIQPPANATYPITSDPWLWKDLIKKAQWAWHSEGWTLMVTPTKWQRVWNGYLPGKAGWNELYKKYKNRGLNTNLTGMKDQYICHVQIVSIHSPRKATWNLDEWRPNVGYAQTINSSCNPGGYKWFD